MTHGELHCRCALCGKILRESNTVEETIEKTQYTFDTKDCAIMFKRFLAIYGNDFKNFLGQEQYISDPFWDRVIPNEEEIREIKEEQEQRKRKGVKPEIINVIKDSREIQKLSIDLIRSAKENIQITFSTANAFIQQEKSSVGCQTLEETAIAKKGLNIKILTPPHEQIKQISSKLKDKKLLNIDIKYIEPPPSLSTKITLLVVDRRESLAIKFKDEHETKQHTFDEAVEVATYSNNKSTALSYVTIFESLWKEIEVNEQITDLFEQLKSQDNLQKDFLNIAAHELRAPIQPVLGLAEVLRSKKVDTNEQEELLTIIIRNAKRLKVLTENILDLTRIESRSLSLNKEVFNISEVILDAVSDIKSQSLPNNQMVNIRYDFIKFKEEQEEQEKGIITEILVEADRARLMQVISNLLNNAIKFTKMGTILINLEKKANEKNEVIVSIKDNGPGIDPTIMPILFKKFMTKSDKGTGLGLFISKNIIEAHGGMIWAENNADGKGATFSFTLPLRK